MKQAFKKGDYVDIRDLDKSVIDAIEARFRADGWGEESVPCDLGINECGELNTWNVLCRNKLTVDECLFAGAPEDCDKVMKTLSGYVWFNGDSFTSFSGSKYNYYGESNLLIYTRQKEERESIGDVKPPSFCRQSDADNWHEKGERPPVGIECEISYNMSREGYDENYSEYKVGYIAGEDKGELWVRFKDYDKTLAITECQFRPIQPKKIDMSAFAGSGILYIYGSENKFTLSCVVARRPVWGHWNAVTGLEEVPAYCEGFVYTLRIAERLENTEEIEVNEYGPCTGDMSYIYWPDVVAIRFDSIKEGWVCE